MMFPLSTLNCDLTFLQRNTYFMKAFFSVCFTHNDAFFNFIFATEMNK